MTDPRPGAIVHVELSSRDLARSRRFLENVFDWKFTNEATGAMEYWSFETPDGPRGGLVAPQEGMEPSSLNYILVASVDASLKRIAAQGGRLLTAKQEIPTVGWFAVFEIPGGPVAAIFEPVRPAPSA